MRGACAPIVVVLLSVIGEARPARATRQCTVPTAAERPGTFTPFITDTAIPQAPGTLAVQPTWRLRWSGSRYDAGWELEDAGGDLTVFDGNVRLTYGPFRRAEVYAIVFYEMNWLSGASPPVPGGQRSASAGGLGDTTFTLKYELLEPGRWHPVISAVFTTIFPTGHHHPLDPAKLGTDELGSGAYGFVPGINLSKYLRPFLLYANLWYEMSTTARSTVVTDGTVTTQTTHERDTLFFSLAAELPIARGPFTLLVEYNSFWDFGPILGPAAEAPRTVRMRVLPGLEYVPGPHWAFALGVEIDVAGRSTRRYVSPIASVIYTPWTAPARPPPCAPAPP